VLTLIFPLRDIIFSLREGIFPLRDVIFLVGEYSLSLGALYSPRENITAKNASKSSMTIIESAFVARPTVSYEPSSPQ
jgi:hypothetical protein